MGITPSEVGIAFEAGFPSSLETDPAKVRIVAKARYNGRIYFVRFYGSSFRGYNARLTTLDGKLDFWARCAQPQEQCDGNEKTAAIVHHFAAYPTLAEIREHESHTAHANKLSGDSLVELILEAAGGRCGIAGSITCPYCESKLTFGITECNGHVWARCQTDGCIRFAT